jgi:NADPH:quinone reductase-like Zn-dependent oxidoreductase
MKKVVIHRAGSYDELVIEERPDLQPGAGEVVVETRAVGVNYADCIVRMGLYESAKTYVGWPITPGFEFSGRVKKLGAGITDIEVGAPVFGVTRFDAYATEVRVPRDQILPRPPAIDDAKMAAFPAVFLTAWYALVELCRLRSGMHVLVHSAAGGVGGALVQIARLHGCETVGVVGGPHKVEVARALGATAVIDKSREDLWQKAKRLAPEGYDVVLDANGVETLRQSYRHLRPTGRLVIYGFHTMMPKDGRGKPNWPKLAVDWLRTPRFNPLDLTNDNKSVMAFNLSYLFERADVLREAMTTLLGWLSDGKIWPHEVETFALADVQEAHRRIESGQTTGKLVLLTS